MIKTLEKLESLNPTLKLQNLHLFSLKLLFYTTLAFCDNIRTYHVQVS